MDIFCKIINKEVPSYTIFEDEILMVIMDVNPQANGHLLIIPKNHYQDLYDISNEVLFHIMNISRKMCNLLNEKLGCDGITLIQNNGICQEVKHYHLHLVPKYENIVELLSVEEVFHKIVD